MILDTHIAIYKWNQEKNLYLFSGKINKINREPFKLDPQRAAGLYFVRVKMKQQVFTAPLVVY